MCSCPNKRRKETELYHPPVYFYLFLANQKGTLKNKKLSEEAKY